MLRSAALFLQLLLKPSIFLSNRTELLLQTIHFVAQHSLYMTVFLRSAGRDRHTIYL